MPASSAFQPALTADEILRQIAERSISLVPAFDGRLWSASVERVKNKRRFTRADMEVVSAIGSTPREAVERLMLKLEEGAVLADDITW